MKLHRIFEIICQTIKLSVEGNLQSRSRITLMNYITLQYIITLINVIYITLRGKSTQICTCLCMNKTCIRLPNLIAFDKEESLTRINLIWDFFFVSKM